MSMGMVLEGVRDWLRGRNNWGINECGIQALALPPNLPTQKYIAIEDGGVEGGPEETYGLTEIFTVTIGIWRRPSNLMHDSYGQMLLTEDLYRPEIQTLDEIERRLLHFLHHRHQVTNFINAKFGLPDAGRGDKFITSLKYRGRTGLEAAVVTPELTFLGRKMRFRGLKRVQKISEDLG